MAPYGTKQISAKGIFFLFGFYNKSIHPLPPMQNTSGLKFLHVNLVIIFIKMVHINLYFLK